MQTEAVDKAREALKQAEQQAAYEAGWRALDTAPRDGTKVHLWMVIHASPMSFGMGDEFAVPDSWFDGSKWVHLFRGKPAELRRECVKYWRPAADSLEGVETWGG